MNELTVEGTAKMAAGLILKEVLIRSLFRLFDASMNCRKCLPHRKK